MSFHIFYDSNLEFDLKRDDPFHEYPRRENQEPSLQFTRSNFAGVPTEYANSKLMNLLIGLKMQRMLKEEGSNVRCYVVHPGMFSCLLR